MGIETMENINRKEFAEDLLSEGREVLGKLFKESEEMGDDELEDIYYQSREILDKLEIENYRDYIMLSGKAIEVYRKIGKQDVSQELVNKNKRRLG